VRKLSFMGSMTTVAAVSRAAADSITPLSLELGGKNASTVFEDADLELAIRNVVDCVLGGGSSIKREHALLFRGS
jgi:acyl-CoA reductase-like NAD-dependent aldehyde dehydrogenase